VRLALVEFEGRYTSGDELRIYTTCLAKSKRFDAFFAENGWCVRDFTFDEDSRA